MIGSSSKPNTIVVRVNHIQTESEGSQIPKFKLPDTNWNQGIIQKDYKRNIRDNIS